MSIVKTVGKGVAWNTMSNVIGKFIIFANVFLMLHYMTVYEYGLGQLVLSVVSTLGIFMLPGLSSAILADLAAERGRGEHGKMKALFWQFSLLSMILALCAWTILFFGSDTAARLSGNATIGYLLKIASFTVLVTPLRSISNMLASVELRFFDQSFYPILEETFKLIFLAIFLPFMHIGLVGMLYAIVFSQIATVIAYLARSISAYRTFSHTHVTDLHAFWRIIFDHRKWSIANSYVGNLGQTISLWIIRLLLGTEAVGIYSFAQGIYSQVASFLPLASILAPILPRYVDHRETFARYLKSSIKAQSLIAMPLIIATFVGLPILIWIFPKYTPAAPLIMIIIFSIIPTSIATLYISAFSALKEQYMYFHSTVWKIMFISVLTPLSIILWGMPGIGIGALLISLATMIERSRRMKRVLPEFTFSVRDIFVFDEYERAILMTWFERLQSSWDALRLRVRG